MSLSAGESVSTFRSFGTLDDRDGFLSALRANGFPQVPIYNLLVRRHAKLSFFLAFMHEDFPSSAAMSVMLPLIRRVLEGWMEMAPKREPCVHKDRG